MIYVAHIRSSHQLYDSWTPAYSALREPKPLYGRNSKYQKDDFLYKGIIEDLFEDFLRFMIPDAADRFDFSRGFEFLNLELDQLFPPQDDVYKSKIIDKLVKVFTKDGVEEWVLTHVEIQDRYEQGFSRRMFSYFSRIFDKYGKPITAFAILTEPVAKSRSNSFEMSCAGTSLVYTFNVLKVSEQSEIELMASENPFAMVLLIAKTALKGKKQVPEERDAFLLDVKKKLLRHLLSKKMAREKIDALLNFLKYHIRFSDEINNELFEQELTKITGRNNTMGIRELLLDRARHEGKLEGNLEGKLKKQLEIAREMLKDKFPIETIARLTKLSVSQIEQL